MARLSGLLERATRPKPRQEETPEERKQRAGARDSQRIVTGAISIGLIMFFAVGVFAFQPGGPGWGAFGTGLVVGGGGVAVGAFFGLLFGVPRLLDRPAESAGDQEASSSRSGYQANTNLTEISDWLTKIIVGVSLIQLGTIRDQLLALVEALAPEFGATPAAAPFVAGLLATATLTGFLTGYLLARIYLPRVFNEADVIMRVTQESSRVVVAAVQQQTLDSSTADADAIRLVDQALGSGPTAQHPSPEELTDAIQRASPGTRASLVSRAADLRSRTWSADKPTMELTIPVLRALVKANDTDHYLHGQLGFALKDQRQADNDGAIAELTRAIELRGDPGRAGWLYYEWNRGQARARVEFAKGEPSDPPTKDSIVADLGTAFSISELRELAIAEPDFTNWAKMNKVNLNTLKAR